MKTYKKALLLYFTGFTLSVLLHSCVCTNTYRITGKGFLNAYDLTRNQIDTIRTPFLLLAGLELEEIVGMDNLSLIQNTNAFSCSDEFVNALVESSLVLKCNRDFQYKNETITQNSDFSEIEELKYDFLYEASFRIFFEENFLANAEFENGEYVFSIEIETDDGLKLNNEVTVQIEL